ncbi:hypothetical protein AB6F61_06900 [Providencia hangzhouensis]|uniref:hypothetical protein n=1 Tax=Providencia hangzhouensis TaxID=3031799 RepID=UPI0034DD9C88
MALEAELAEAKNQTKMRCPNSLRTVKNSKPSCAKLRQQRRNCRENRPLASDQQVKHGRFKQTTRFAEAKRRRVEELKRRAKPRRSTASGRKSVSTQQQKAVRSRWLRRKNS